MVTCTLSLPVFDFIVIRKHKKRRSWRNGGKDTVPALTSPKHIPRGEIKILTHFSKQGLLVHAHLSDSVTETRWASTISCPLRNLLWTHISSASMTCSPGSLKLVKREPRWTRTSLESLASMQCAAVSTWLSPMRTPSQKWLCVGDGAFRCSAAIQGQTPWSASSGTAFTRTLGGSETARDLPHSLAVLWQWTRRMSTKVIRSSVIFDSIEFGFIASSLKTTTPTVNKWISGGHCWAREKNEESFCVPAVLGGWRSSRGALPD